MDNLDTESQNSQELGSEAEFCIVSHKEVEPKLNISGESSPIQEWFFWSFLVNETDFHGSFSSYSVLDNGDKIIVLRVIGH